MRLKLSLIVCAILFLSGCSSPVQLENPVNAPLNNQNGEVIDKGPAESVISEYVYIRDGSKFFLYNEPDPYVLTTVGEVEGGALAEVLGSQGEWVHIKHNAQEGWIPEWYLKQRPDQGGETSAVGVDENGNAEKGGDLEAELQPVRDVKVDPLVLNHALAGTLYPNGPEIVDLSQGKLLTPLKEWGDFYEVSIIVYDIPAVLWAWVPKVALSEIDEIQPIEGYLPEGTEVYETWDFAEIPSTIPQEVACVTSVWIQAEQEGYVRVGAAGGWSGWTRKENLAFIKTGI